MGFFARVTRGSPIESNTVFRTTVKQKFAIKVPEANASAVQSGLERWAASKGWAAVVKAEPEGDFVKFSFEHDQSMPGKPPELPMDTISEELQKVLEDAVGG